PAGIAYFWTSDIVAGSGIDAVAVLFCDALGLVAGTPIPMNAIHVAHARAVRTMSSVRLTTRCVPTTCAAQNATCGTVGDACGNTVDCGSCSDPQTCGGGGVPNQCGCIPTTCAAQGDANCGTLPDGCGGTLDCGTCEPPLSCGGDGRPNHCGIIL